jgi:diacylglycerol kinase family enzyme
MKHIFMLNPSAGQGAAAALEETILSASAVTGVPVEIYHTQSVRDAEVYSRTVCLGLGPEETVRFYACGGDGTLNEAANGIYGFPRAELAFIPTGTGNDFARDFAKPEAFLDIQNQLLGTAVPVDLIEYRGVLDGEQKTRVCANMINIGFDCNVVHRTSRLKTLPLVSGSLAYILGILIEMIEKSGVALKVEHEGEALCDGKILLCAIANGSYCGGGLKGSPRAINHDGLFDVQVIRDVTRRLMLVLLPKYGKGTHLEDPRTAPFLDYRQVTSLTVTPCRSPLRVCVDGEMEMLDGPMELRILPAALRFVVPKGIGVPAE